MGGFPYRLAGRKCGKAESREAVVIPLMERSFKVDFPGDA